MMNAMDTVQLFSKGEYMVIYPDMMTYSQTEAEKYLWETGKMQCDESETFKRRARSLLVVVSTPPTENYENFTKIVREYNAKEPFNFTTPSLFHLKNISKKCSDHMASSIPTFARTEPPDTQSENDAGVGLKQDANAQMLIVRSIAAVSKLYAMKSEININFLQQSFFDFKKSPEGGIHVHISNGHNENFDDFGSRIQTFVLIVGIDT
uniref:Uncharacterized protein n=1 Tax=Megaselia scalaris TaxID=36166 RepID=T1GN08_MEGSC